MEFYEKLAHQQLEDGTKKLIHFINDKQITRYLYKYRSLWDYNKNCINEFTESIFTDCELWFSKPDSFNDPFDCKIHDTFEDADFDIKQIYRRMGASEDIINSVIDYSDPKERKEKAIRVKEFIFSNRGICCFSEIKNNILMWSHYAHNHEGICIEFDMLKNPSYFVYPIKVNYTKKYPTGCFFKDHKDYIMDRLSTKFQDWSYEKEYRLTKERSGLYKFDKMAISAVYFGCNAVESQVKSFIEMMEKNGYDIDYYHGKIDEKEYKINFCRVEKGCLAIPAKHPLK